MQIRIPTVEEMEELAARAVTDDNALRELGQLNSRLSRAANERIRGLERAGETGDALQWLIRQTGRNRLSQAKTGGAEFLLRRAREAAAFLHRKESSIGGVRQVQSKMLKSLAASTGFGGRMTKAAQRRFTEFLKTDAFAELKKFLGSGIMKDLQEANADRADALSELEEAYNAYIEKRTDEDLVSIYDSWRQDQELDEAEY